MEPYIDTVIKKKKCLNRQYKYSHLGPGVHFVAFSLILRKGVHKVVAVANI